MPANSCPRNRIVRTERGMRARSATLKVPAATPAPYPRACGILNPFDPVYPRSGSRLARLFGFELPDRRFSCRRQTAIGYYILSVAEGAGLRADRVKSDPGQGNSLSSRYGPSPGVKNGPRRASGRNWRRELSRMARFVGGQRTVGEPTDAFSVIRRLRATHCPQLPSHGVSLPGRISPFRHNLAQHGKHARNTRKLRVVSAGRFEFALNAFVELFPACAQGTERSPTESQPSNICYGQALAELRCQYRRSSSTLSQSAERMQSRPATRR